MRWCDALFKFVIFVYSHEKSDLLLIFSGIIFQIILNFYENILIVIKTFSYFMIYCYYYYYMQICPYSPNETVKTSRNYSRGN